MTPADTMRAAVEALSLMYANSHGNTDDEISARLRARSALSLLHSALDNEQAEWHDDKPDQWTEQIEAAHPLRSKAYEQYDTAMAMVGSRRSKHALVELVCWLLQRPITPVEAGKVGVAAGVPDAEVLRKALRRAFSLGQTYWQQADSESLRQQELSNKTQAMFDKLIEDTVAAAGGESK